MRQEYINFSHMGLVTVAGQQRSGKTNTLRCLASQAVLNGWQVYILDGHMNSNHKDGFANSMRPLHDEFVYIASSIEEIELLLERLGYLSDYQVSVKDSIEVPRTLVILDELIPIIDQVVDKDSLVKLFRNFSTQWRKTNCKLVITSQAWESGIVGSATARSAASHRIIHRIDEREAKFVLPLSNWRKKALSMESGVAIVYNEGSCCKVKVPWVGHDSIVWMAEYLGSKFAPIDFQLLDPHFSKYSRNDIENSVNTSVETCVVRFTPDNGFYASEKPISNFESDVESGHILMIQEHLKEGWKNKRELLVYLFDVKPGNSLKYKYYSRIYNEAKEGLTYE